MKRKKKKKKKPLTTRNNNPEPIQQHKIPIKVIILGPRILNPVHQKVKRTRPVIENIPVKLSSGDDDLQRVSEGVICGDERRKKEG